MQVPIKEPVATGSNGTEETHIAKFKSVFEGKKIKKVAIFSHNNPDPDSLASSMAVEWILKKAYSIESQAFYSGDIAHPQNVAMMNMLDPNIRRIEEYKPEDYDLNILVDTVPSNSKIDVKFDLIIDHHKETCPLDYPGVFINLKAGSCCGTVFDIITKMGLSFGEPTEGEGNEIDSTLATAMLVGISTDTENLMSDDTTQYEFDAWSNLFPYRSSVRLKKIINFPRPRFWVERKAQAAIKAKIDEGYAIVGMGIIPGKHRDLIADMAQELISWEEVHTAIVFAVINGERVEGSIRSSNASVSVPKLSKDLGGNCGGNGGGKLGKGAYKYDLGGGSVTEDDSEDIAKDMWSVLERKEIARIERIISG